MISGAIELATTIAQKSPVAVQGTKTNLNYSRDHTVQEGLEFVVSFRRSITVSTKEAPIYRYRYA